MAGTDASLEVCELFLESGIGVGLEFAIRSLGEIETIPEQDRRELIAVLDLPLRMLTSALILIRAGGNQPVLFHLKCGRIVDPSGPRTACACAAVREHEASPRLRRRAERSIRPEHRRRVGSSTRESSSVGHTECDGLGPGRSLTRNGEDRGAVVRKIDRDANRFKQIVRGKIKSDLRKYITHGEMIGKTGGEFVSIPLPQIEIPEFRYGTKNRGGVGQGPGDVGTPIGRSSDGESGQGAGERPGQHILEVELTMDDLAQILGEELALPRIEPKGRANIIEEKDKYTGIRQAGPESLRHFKRTYKKALKRQIASNHVRPPRPPGHPDPRGQALPLLEPDLRCPSSTPSSST